MVPKAAQRRRHRERVVLRHVRRDLARGRDVVLGLGLGRGVRGLLGEAHDLLLAVIRDALLDGGPMNGAGEVS